MPAHAHLNLLGFVTMFLSALYYRRRARGGGEPARPVIRPSSVSQALSCSRSGSAVCCLAATIASMPVVVAGALTVLLGMALFAVIVFRTSGPATRDARRCRRAAKSARYQLARSSDHISTGRPGERRGQGLWGPGVRRGDPQHQLNSRK